MEALFGNGSFRPVEDGGLVHVNPNMVESVVAFEVLVEVLLSPELLAPFVVEVDPAAVPRPAKADEGSPVRVFDEHTDLVSVSVFLHVTFSTSIKDMVKPVSFDVRVRQNH